MTSEPDSSSITVTSRGFELLNNPEINKGTAFTPAERRELLIEGLLPAAIESIDEQLVRQRHKFDQLHDAMERHVYLRALQDSNEVLFYRFLCANLEEMMPIVYTPTVGAACQRFSHIYRRPHGVFISYEDRGNMAAQFDAITEQIDVIVVTDGQRILGLGDQGVGGMGIPIGKLSLYTAAGGINPLRTLPIVLDVGTNNTERLDDPLYLGWRHERVTGDDYGSFVDEFVQTVAARFPGVLLQWEDFAGVNAAPLLDRYRHRLLSFNDDIQGTAAVALGAIESAVAAANSTIDQQRVLIVGAGSAGTGIAAMVRDAMALAGVADPTAKLFLTDREGLLHDRRAGMTGYQQPFAQRWEDVADWASADGPTPLADVVAKCRPTVLIGVSGAGGLFTEDLVRTMAADCKRPIIMPMSNPTSKAEAVPADLLTWTDGRALIATGSPFEPVEIGDRTITISQANNVYVFPGLGLGAIVAKATTITDAMFVAAAAALAEAGPSDHTPSEIDPDGGLLPPIDEVGAVSQRVAAAVARAACDEGTAPAATDDEIADRINAYWWSPKYPTIVGG